jgi:hypothetical protein
MLPQQVLGAFNYGIALYEMLRFFENRRYIWWQSLKTAKNTSLQHELKENVPTCGSLTQRFDRLWGALNWTLHMRSECFEVSSASTDRTRAVLDFVYCARWGDGTGKREKPSSPVNFQASITAVKEELGACSSSGGPARLPDWVPESLRNQDFECFSRDDDCKRTHGLYCKVLQWSLDFLEQVWAIHGGTRGGGAAVRSGMEVAGTGGWSGMGVAGIRERSDVSLALMTGYFLQMEYSSGVKLTDLSEVSQSAKALREKENEESRILSCGASFELRCLRQYLAGKAVDQEAPELRELGAYLAGQTIHQERDVVQKLGEYITSKTFDQRAESVVLGVLLRTVQRVRERQEKSIKNSETVRSSLRGTDWFLWDQRKKLENARTNLLLLKQSEDFFDGEMQHRQEMLRRKEAAGKGGGTGNSRPRQRPQSARGADHTSVPLGKPVVRRSSWRS